jgi:hypothetical protein
MREVRVNSERFSDSDLLHHDVAQTVNEAVGLVLVALEVRKCSPFFVGRCPMDTRELFRVELLAKGHGFPVTDFERQRDRFGDYVIRGEQVVGETKTLERVEDLNDASVMRIRSDTSANRNPVSRNVTPWDDRTNSDRAARPCRLARP